MKHNIPTSILTTITLAGLLGGCANDAEPEPISIDELETRAAVLPANTKAANGYYVARQDLRKCAYPACGGWFLSKANADKMFCPEGGGIKDECYVPDLAAPEGVNIGSGDLLHGTFDTADILGTTWGTFAADYAYASVLAEPWPYGSHDLIYDTGIVCITAPCPSTALAHLNAGWGLGSIDFFFWGADATEDQLLEDAFLAEYGDDTAEPGAGALVFGDFWLLLGDVYYSVYNVYTLRTPQLPVCVVHDIDTETTAWTFASEAEATPLIEALTGTVTVLDGTCGEQLLYCPAVYEPVHGGIDANGGVCETHGNACEFRSAVISAAGDLKAKGSWTAGSC